MLLTLILNNAIRSPCRRSGMAMKGSIFRDIHTSFCIVYRALFIHGFGG